MSEPSSRPAGDEFDRDVPLIVRTVQDALWTWQWELHATGAGPDHTALLRFEEQESGQLASDD